MNTILIIDDEGTLVGALSDKLQLSGYVIITAKNGKEGLDVALSKKPDLIILDVAMPVMDGLSFLRELRGHPWGDMVKVIILTNLPLDDQNLNEVVKQHPAFYLIKSDETLESIEEKIHELLSHTE